MSTIQELQQRVGAVNAANGWRTTDESKLDPKARVNAQVARLALITTEVAEAIEEIRNGRDVGDTYFSGGIEYSGADDEDALEEWEPIDANGNARKPEGVASELADIVIRSLDAADAWGIDLMAAVELKLAYNATRGHRHGGKTL